MKNSYSSDDICVVGIGCFLPGAKNVDEFWKNLVSGKSFFKEFPKNRWKKNIYYSKNKNLEDKSYTSLAGFVDYEEIYKIVKKNEGNFNSKLEAIAVESVVQAVDCIGVNDLSKNSSVIFGCMSPDAELAFQLFNLRSEKDLFNYIQEKFDNSLSKKIISQIKAYSKENKIDEKTVIKNIFVNSFTNTIKSKYQLKGENFIVDGACGSSLAAINVAVKKLKSKENDMCIVGGVGNNLGAESFVAWSKIKGISSKSCLPFDESRTGILPGEGSAAFVLERLEDAIKSKHKIYGVIKNIDVASDGKTSSIFSPTKDGQIRVYSKVYNNEMPKLDYIECHGTGTIRGDKVEIDSIGEYFSNQKICIGSVKSQIGHTKGAAGAAGFLKSLLIIQNKEIPPSKYIKNQIKSEKGNVFVNKKIISLKNRLSPINLGVSSFGFGGVNFHLNVQEFKETNLIKNSNLNFLNDEKIIVDISSVSFEEFKNDFKNYKFKVPINSLNQIDNMQLMGLMGVSKILNSPNVNISQISKDKISVISAITTGLEKLGQVGERLKIDLLPEILKGINKHTINSCLGYKDSKFPKITEDTAHGILNNVVPGKICNVFDFRGKNFNIDSDFASFPCSLKIISNFLNLENELFFLIFAEEKFDELDYRLVRPKLYCALITNKKFANKYNLPIKYNLKDINFLGDLK